MSDNGNYNMLVPDRQITVTARLMTGKKEEIPISGTATVGELRKKIRDRIEKDKPLLYRNEHNVPMVANTRSQRRSALENPVVPLPDYIRIVFKGKMLKDDQKLDSLGITDGTTVHLRIKLPIQLSGFENISLEELRRIKNLSMHQVYTIMRSRF